MAGSSSAKTRFALLPGHDEVLLTGTPQIGFPAYGIEAVRPPSTGIACPLT
jgi:hypothetical protein